MKPLTCLWANFVCRHDGSWHYTAELENEETEADVSFDLQFDLIGVSSPFGAVLKGQLERLRKWADHQDWSARS